jgi:hypothetical protein
LPLLQAGQKNFIFFPEVNVCFSDRIRVHFR